MNPEESKDFFAQRASPRAVLAFVVVILVLIFGGLYLWGSQLTPNDLGDMGDKTRYTNNEPETTRAKADVQASAVLSSSDELSAIEADLSSTNVSNEDSDMETMNAELVTFEGQLQ